MTERSLQRRGDLGREIIAALLLDPFAELVADEPRHGVIAALFLAGGLEILRDVCLSPLMYGCLRRQASPSNLSILPLTIFSMMFSGLPDWRA